MAIFQKKSFFTLILFSIFCFAETLSAQVPAAPELTPEEEFAQALKKVGGVAVGMATSIASQEAVGYLNPAHFVQAGLKHIPFFGNYLAKMATNTVVTIEAVRLIFSQMHRDIPFKTRFKLCLQSCTRLSEKLILLGIIGYCWPVALVSTPLYIISFIITDILASRFNPIA